jgi:hypothetical protein
MVPLALQGKGNINFNMWLQVQPPLIASIAIPAKGYVKLGPVGTLVSPCLAG